jgi:hypothetical protein
MIAPLAQTQPQGGLWHSAMPQYYQNGCVRLRTRNTVQSQPRDAKAAEAERIKSVIITIKIISTEQKYKHPSASSLTRGN